MKFIESQGIPRKNIIDGAVFQIPNFDFHKFLNEGIAYGIIEGANFSALALTVYPQILISTNEAFAVALGRKSYIAGNAFIDGTGIITVNHFSCLSWNINFNLLLTLDHDYRRISNYSLGHGAWYPPKDFYKPKSPLQINIGNDVWIGRGSILKCTNPDKPLIIGDGAVIASDSVVVKNVPPYAIVGGNPAKIIKYRFSEYIIESLLRIKWWDWDIDKIHDNFKYFNRVEEFVEMHDKGV